MKRLSVVEAHVINLRERDVEAPIPGLPAIDRNRRSAVVGFDDPPSVARNPCAVMVLVYRGRNVVKRLAAVARFDQIFGTEDHVVAVARIDVETAHVKRTLIDQRVSRHQTPMRAGVVRPPQETALGLNERIHAGRGNGNSDPPHVPARQTVSGEMPPRHAAIERLVDAVDRSAARETPRHTAKLPDARIDDVRMLRVDHDIRDAAAGADVERLPPLFARRRSCDTRRARASL